MHRYRVFFLDDQNRIMGARIVECDHDGLALALAKQHIGKAAVAEVWQSARAVGRISAQPAQDRFTHLGDAGRIRRTLASHPA